MEPRPQFVRTISNPGSPGLLLHELLSPEEKSFLIKGNEDLVAKAMEGFSQCTFHNCLEYLLVLLGLPSSVAEYSHLDNFQDKVKLALRNWTTTNGEKATFGLLTENLRNHRSISEKIYGFLKENQCFKTDGVQSSKNNGVKGIQV